MVDNILAKFVESSIRDREKSGYKSPPFSLAYHTLYAYACIATILEDK